MINRIQQIIENEFDDGMYSEEYYEWLMEHYPSDKDTLFSMWEHCDYADEFIEYKLEQLQGVDTSE